MPVNMIVENPGGRIDEAAQSSIATIRRIYENQVACSDLGKSAAARVDQEVLAVARYRDTEMVCRRFVVIEPGRPPKGGRKFYP